MRRKLVRSQANAYRFTPIRIYIHVLMACTRVIVHHTRSRHIVVYLALNFLLYAYVIRHVFLERCVLVVLYTYTLRILYTFFDVVAHIMLL